MIHLQTWSDELAATAQRWADQCTYKHDKHRNMMDGTYVGQNIKTSGFTAQTGYDPSDDKDEVIINSFMLSFNRGSVKKNISDQ